MLLVSLDLEGVLVPEFWIGVAEKTGIEALRLTTRDIADYDELMTHRLKVLKDHGMGLADIQSTIDDMVPLAGAEKFVESIRSRHQLIILSDTFYDFAEPMMRALNWPTLFCHRLEIGGDGSIVNYHLRQTDQKAKAIRALSSLNFRTLAAGDSYNDLSMLAEADRGILFRPPEKVVVEFPQYPVVDTHDALEQLIDEFAASSDQ